MSFTIVVIPWTSFPLESARAQTNVTIHANQHKMVGGVGQLNRAQYFNHWGSHVIQGNTNLGNLSNEIWEADGLHSVTGREPFGLDSPLASGLAEDPANPGYFKTSDLVSRLQDTTPWSGYRWRLEDSERYESLRVNPDPVWVLSGKASGSWPAWLTNGSTMPMSHQGLAYAQLLNTYLEEVVYGTGPSQGYLPFNQDNFYIEIMNEPNLELGPGGVTWDDVIEMHKNVTETVKAAHPQVKIGGASVGDAPLESWNPHRWDFKKQMMDDMTTWNAEFDFWTFHTYDWFHVNSSDEIEEGVGESPGHVTGMMDLFEAYSNKSFGDPKQFAITEYGRAGDSAFGQYDFGSYTRAERQWDLSRTVREMMGEFMLRPDRIINASPFIAPQWWDNATPSTGYHTLWDKDASGDWVETVVGNMYRMYNNISGEYVPIEDDNLDLQTIAFRDGDEVYVILNNMDDVNHVVNLSTITGLGNVVSASMDRLIWNGSSHIFLDDADVSGTWQNLTLLPEEGAVLTLTLDRSPLFDIAYDEDTYYSSVTEEAVDLLGRSSVMPIIAGLQDAVSARVRVSFARPNATPGESFDVVVNGNVVTVPATGVIDFDGEDKWLVSREVDIPLNYLVDGTNNIQIDFSSQTGETVSTVLVVTRSIGDFNNSGTFDHNDVSLLAAQFGPAGPGSRYDLLEDGVIDIHDVQHLVETLRGTVMGDLNLDGFVGIGDLNVVLANWNQLVNPGDAALGDTSGDGFVGIDDLNTVLALWNTGIPPTGNVNIPEPATTSLITVLLGLGMLRRQ